MAGLDQRAQEFAKNKAPFLKSAVIIFEKAAALVGTNANADPHILGKILHSILFLGNIHKPMCSPEEIFKALYEKLQGMYPEPFERYNKDVPLQTPFSYFLELVVSNANGNEENVKEELFTTFQKCSEGFEGKCPLVSSVICICEVSDGKYYGGSLACPGKIARDIMTAVSCFHVWDPYVSSAVLDVFSQDTTEPRFPRCSMLLPNSVQCRAYAIEDRTVVKAPCLRCHELYSLPNPSDSRNEPGNCAETEAISNLFKNKREVRKRTTMKKRVLKEMIFKQTWTRNTNSKKVTITVSIEPIFSEIKGKPERELQGGLGGSDPPN